MLFCMPVIIHKGNIKQLKSKYLCFYYQKSFSNKPQAVAEFVKSRDFINCIPGLQEIRPLSVELLHNAVDLTVQFIMHA